MSLPKFIVGMFFALATVVASSYAASVSLGTILVRVAVCGLIIQVGYFVLVYVMVARSARMPGDKASNAETSLNGANSPSARNSAPGEAFTDSAAP